MRFIVALALVLTLCPSAFAQSPSQQAGGSFLKFLKTGDFIGVQSFEGTVAVSISTYSKREFEMAKQLVNRTGRPMYAEELANESELIKKALADFLSENSDADFDTAKVMMVPLVRTYLATITEVGDDYILVLAEKSKRRTVIPKAWIGKIYLDANPVRFVGPRRVVYSRSN